MEQIKEEYRLSARKHAKRGLVLLFTPILVFIIPFLVPTELTDQAFIVTLVSTVFLAIVGIILAVYFGVGTTVLLKGFDILTRVDSQPILTKRYAIAKINDAYLLTHGLSGHLYVVAFRGTPQFVSGYKVKLPRAFFRWESRIDIAGAKWFRREGIFSIPVSLEECVSGEAVLYGVPYQPSRYNWNVPEFSREQLLAAVEHITADASRLY
ncbi:MAG: hypothetical protein ACXABD_22650 [Candidatus Thorarchaeota archaeon]|jgi:hypothetical protein